MFLKEVIDGPAHGASASASNRSDESGVFQVLQQGVHVLPRDVLLVRDFHYQNGTLSVPQCQLKHGA